MTPDEVVAYLRNFADGFNFKRRGVDQNLGRDMAHTLVDRILDRCEDSVDPGRVPWPENSTKEPPVGGYKGQKERQYGWDDNPNRRTGQMVSQEAMMGNRTTIEEREIVIRYGNDVAPDVSKSPNGYISERDKLRTDTEKATYAHTGGRHGVKRPFFGIGAGDKEAVIETGRENLHQHIRESPYGKG